MTPRPENPAPGTDDVHAALAALGAPPMPADVSARIGAVLAEEMRGGARAAGTRPAAASDDRPMGAATAPERPRPSGSRLRLVRRRHDGTGAPQRRLPSPKGTAGRRAPGRPRSAVVAGLVAAAVVAVAAVAVTVGAPPSPQVVSEESDLQAAGAGAVGEQGAGPLADPARRRECLTAAGVPDPEAALLGGRPYAVRGEPGRLLVLGTAVRGRFRLLVVDCDAGRGRLLASTTAGR